MKRIPFPPNEKIYVISFVGEERRFAFGEMMVLRNDICLQQMMFRYAKCLFVGEVTKTVPKQSEAIDKAHSRGYTERSGGALLLPKDI